MSPGRPALTSSNLSHSALKAPLEAADWLAQICPQTASLTPCTLQAGTSLSTPLGRTEYLAKVSHPHAALGNPHSRASVIVFLFF